MMLDRNKLVDTAFPPFHLSGLLIVGFSMRLEYWPLHFRISM